MFINYICVILVLKLSNVQSVMTDEKVLNELMLLRNEMAILRQQNKNHHTIIVKIKKIKTSN